MRSRSVCIRENVKFSHPRSLSFADSLTEEIDMSIAKIKENLAYIEEYKSFSETMQDEREEDIQECSRFI